MRTTTNAHGSVVAKLESEWAQKTFSGSKKNAALHDSKMALLDRLQFPSNELLKALGKDRASRPNAWATT